MITFWLFVAGMITGFFLILAAVCFIVYRAYKSIIIRELTQEEFKKGLF